MEQPVAHSSLGKKLLRIGVRLLIGIICLFLLVFAAVWSVLKVPAVQNYLVTKATHFVSDKTKTKVVLQHIDLAFPKSIVLEGLFLEDLQHDTLLSVNRLEVDIDMLALVHKEVNVDLLEINALQAGLKRSKTTQQFNFQFLIEAFAGKEKKKPQVKDTSTSDWKISADKLAFYKCRFALQDSAGGMFLSSALDEVTVEIDKLDLLEKNVLIDKVLVSGVTVGISKGKSYLPADTISSGTPWDKITIQELLIQKTAFSLEDQELKTKMKVAIGSGQLLSGEVSLIKQTVDLGTFSLEKSLGEFLLRRDNVETVKKEAKKVVKEVVVEAKSGWIVTAKKLHMDDNSFKLDNQLEAVPKGLDFNHLALSGIGTNIENVLYSGDKMRANIKHFQVQEKSGLGIRSFRTQFAMDKSHIELKNLDLNTNHSHVGKDVFVSFSSMAEMVATAQIRTNLVKTKLAVHELLLIAPELEKNELIARNKNRVVTVDLQAQGSLKAMQLKKLVVQAGNETYVSVSGKLSHLTDPELLAMDLEVHKISSGRNDLQAMLLPAMLPASLAIPEKLGISGTFKGTMTSAEPHLHLVSSYGNATINGSVADLKGKMPRYDVVLETPDFALGKLLKQTAIGNLGISVKAKGNGFDKNTAVADVKIAVSHISMQQYTFRNILLATQLDQGIANLKASVNDSNVALDLNGIIGIIPSKEYYKLDLHLLGADLYRLGLNTQHIQVSGRLEADFRGNSTQNLSGKADIRDILIVKNNTEYRIDSLLLASVNADGKSSMSVKSTLLTARFDGNMDVLSVGSAIQEHLNQYFAFQSPKKPTTPSKPQNFDFEFRINESPIVKEVFLPSLNEYRSLEVKGGFNSTQDRLWANVELPLATYGSNKIKDFKMVLDTDKDAARYQVNVASFDNGTIKLNQAALNGRVAQNKVGINLMIGDSATKNQKLALQSELIKKGERFRYTILPGGLTLENKPWEVSKGNYIEFGNKFLHIEQFQLTNNNQSLAVQSSADSRDLKATIRNFDLRTISQIAERNDSLVRGVLEGQVELEKFMTDLRFTSNLLLKDLVFKNSKVGNLSIKADNYAEGRYTVKANVTELGNDVQLAGYFQPSDKANALNFTLDVKALQLASFESFSGGQISNSDGKMTGKVTITGSKETPVIDGKLTFEEAHTKVAFLNEKLYMKNESIQVSEKGLSFSSFTVRDTLDNTAIIDGKVLMKDYKDISFDLKLSTKDFLVLNTTAVNNKMYYGKLILDSDIELHGTPDLPKVVARINFSRGSKFTFAVPESKVNIDKGDGVVLFLYDPEDLHPIMLRREDLQAKAKALKGLDIDAKVRVRPHTTFKLLIDPLSGDSLVVRGDADVHFAIDPSGKTSLSGIYTLSNGSYKAYIEGLATKEFQLVKDSKIIWNGDPLDAQVDLSARYNVRTSASELMTIGGNYGSGIIQDSSVLAKPVMFEVYLIMRGELLKPTISFRLDMPENQRSIGGGAIYEKVQQLNQNEAELNKQVFSLLALNKFMASSSAGGGGGGVSGFARSSVSKLMSDQLNRLSAQYLKGVEVNFDVQSYDYQQNGKSQSQTLVNVGLKKNFDRLSVEVGGNVPVEGPAASKNNVANLTGDVQVGYKLTKDGRYQLKGFRQNEVDNIANGVITETGAGVVYTRDYNRTKELFKAPPKRKRKNRNK